MSTPLPAPPVSLSSLPLSTLLPRRPKPALRPHLAPARLSVHLSHSRLTPLSTPQQPPTRTTCRTRPHRRPLSPQPCFRPTRPPTPCLQPVSLWPLQSSLSPMRHPRRPPVSGSIRRTCRYRPPLPCPALPPPHFPRRPPHCHRRCCRVLLRLLASTAATYISPHQPICRLPRPSRWVQSVCTLPRPATHRPTYPRYIPTQPSRCHLPHRFC